METQSSNDVSPRNSSSRKGRVSSIHIGLPDVLDVSDLLSKLPDSPTNARSGSVSRLRNSVSGCRSHSASASKPPLATYPPQGPQPPTTPLRSRSQNGFQQHSGASYVAPPLSPHYAGNGTVIGGDAMNTTQHLLGHSCIGGMSMSSIHEVGLIPLHDLVDIFGEMDDGVHHVKRHRPSKGGPQPPGTSNSHAGSMNNVSFRSGSEKRRCPTPNTSLNGSSRFNRHSGPSPQHHLSSTARSSVTSPQQQRLGSGPLPSSACSSARGSLKEPPSLRGSSLSPAASSLEGLGLSARHSSHGGDTLPAAHPLTDINDELGCYPPYPRMESNKSVVPFLLPNPCLLTPTQSLLPYTTSPHTRTLSPHSPVQISAQMEQYARTGHLTARQHHQGHSPPVAPPPLSHGAPFARKAAVVLHCRSVVDAYYQATTEKR